MLSKLWQLFKTKPCDHENLRCWVIDHAFYIKRCPNCAYLISEDSKQWFRVGVSFRADLVTPNAARNGDNICLKTPDGYREFRYFNYGWYELIDGATRRFEAVAYKDELEETTAAT